VATNRNIRLGLLVLAMASAVAVVAAVPASALVTLHPSESTVAPAGISTPKLPPKLDFVFLMDTTGSMAGELGVVKISSGSIFDSVQADSPDSMFAAAGFDDYPYSTYGDPATPNLDRPYYLVADLTSNRNSFITAVNSMSVQTGGLDQAESQVPALYAASSGLGLSWPGDSTPASGISFRPGAAHVITLVSDAPFHNDKAGDDAYSGFTAPTYADALAALTDDHVRVLAADSGAIGPGGTGAQPDMTAIATDTDGARFDVQTNGTGLVAGVTTALYGLDYDVTASTSCDPLEVSLDQDTFEAISGETAVAHDATITVPTLVDPESLPDEAPVECAVDYTWGDVAIGRFTEDVQVVLPSATELVGETKRKKINATGGVTPNHEGASVEVVLLRKKKSGGYETLKTETVALSQSSAYSAKFSRPKAGKCKLTASFAGDNGHDPSDATDKLSC
jgi:hypothetical protein